MMLMLQNRIENKRSIEQYNQLVERYILEIATSTNLMPESKAKQIPFYISFLIGQDRQCEVYTKFLMGVSDRNAMTQFNN